MAFVLLFAFADLARYLGKKVEAKIGTRTTLELWFRENEVIDTISKDRYRDFIARQLDVTAPSADMEIAFSKIKHWMRKAQKRTIQETWRYLGELVQIIEPDECANYLEEAGYASVKPRNALAAAGIDRKAAPWRCCLGLEV